VRRTHNGLRLESERLLGDESGAVNWILRGDLRFRSAPQYCELFCGYIFNSYCSK
jgi:hypothetical protein